MFIPTTILREYREYWELCRAMDINEHNLLIAITDHPQHAMELAQTFKLKDKGDPQKMNAIIAGAVDSGKILKRTDGRYVITARWALSQGLQAMSWALQKVMAREDGLDV